MTTEDNGTMVLEDLRKDIDRIDDEIASLIAERMKVVDDIGALKKEKDLTVIDPAREDRIIERLCSRCDDDLSPLIEGIFRKIFETATMRQLENTRKKRKEYPDCALVSKGGRPDVFNDIHRYIGKYRYMMKEYSQEELEKIIKDRDFFGLNVEGQLRRVLPPLCDHLTPEASACGSVDTVYIKDDGVWGHNTSYGGFLYALSKVTDTLEDMTVLIIGTGDLSSTVRRACTDMGASKIYTLSLKKNRGGRKDRIGYGDIPAVSSEINLIINTISGSRKPVYANKFANCRAVMDLGGRHLRTPLLMDAASRKMKTCGSLPFNVGRAALSSSAFTGDDISIYSDDILMEMEKRLKNIVFVGMPGCGKSTTARLLASISGRPFVDLDSEIATEAGMTIPEIFEEKGEAEFRRMETEMTERFSERHGLIIATGGGTVMNRKNADLLRLNGEIVYIRRPASKLATKGRPLSSDPEKLKKLEKERIPVYRAVSDRTYDNFRSKSKKKLAKDLEDFFRL